MYRTAEELLSQAQGRSAPLWQIALGDEMELTEKTEQQVLDRLEKIYGVMKHSATEALSNPQHVIGGLIINVSQVQSEYSSLDSSLCNSWINHSATLTFSYSEVNATIGKICAAPTAGACGTLPAVLLSVQGKCSLTLREVSCGLLAAAGLGMIITRNATVAGAEGGYQAECDVTAAMALAAAVELHHGSPETALHARSFYLMNAMGLVCDPMAGLVQVPCTQYDVSQTVNVLFSADWVLTGQHSIIPPGQVIATMYHTDKMLSTQPRETARGGLAAIPAAESIFKNIFIKHEETKAF